MKERRERREGEERRRGDRGREEQEKERKEGRENERSEDEERGGRESERREGEYYSKHTVHHNKQGPTLLALEFTINITIIFQRTQMYTDHSP